MELEIAIPTYFRAETLALKTMPLLSAFDKDIIVLYVEDEIQKNVYNQIFNNEYKIIVTNTSGIGEKRNFIKKHTKARWLLQVDDDLRSIITEDRTLTPEEIKDLGGLQSRYTKEARLANEVQNCKIILDHFGNDALKIIVKSRGYDIRLNYRYSVDK